MSGDPEQEYFVDGLVDDIITALSRVSWFFVIARNSSFTYKGRAVDVRQVGRELGVRYVLEGSVRKAGNRLRITGQLIDTATGTHIWADRFEGALDDIFELQDKITSNVAGAIEPKLQEAEIRRAQAKSTTDLTAYDLYLRALALLDRLTEEAVAEALALLERAIAVDHGYSSAYGLASLCYVTRRTQSWGAVNEAEVRGLQVAKLAFETGKDDPFALAMGGNAISILGGRPEEGLARIERALELNPNSASAWSVGGWGYCFVGELTKSIEHFEKAMRLSPVDPFVYRSYTGIGYANFFLGNYDKSTAWADKALRDRSTWASALRLKLVAVVLANRSDEVPEVLSRLRTLLPDASISTFMRIYPYRPQSMRDILEAALRKTGLPE
jgi:TolB-like protein